MCELKCSFLSTFHSNNYSGLWALISGGAEHGLMTSTRCPTPLTCSLQLIVVTPRRGGGGTGDGLRVRGRGAASVLGCYHYPAGGFHIIVVGEVLLFCTFLHFKIFLIKLLSCFASSHSTIVKLCKKMHISGLRPIFPIGKYEK